MDWALIGTILACSVAACAPVAWIMRDALKGSEPIHKPDFVPPAETVEDYGIPITLPDDGVGLM